MPVLEEGFDSQSKELLGKQLSALLEMTQAINSKLTEQSLLKI